MPDSTNSLNPVECLADDFVRRTRLGERPSLSEYCEQYPQYADEIRKIIRGEKIVRDTGGPVEAPPPPAPGRRSSVPPAGQKPAGGFEPEPQPGS